MEDRPDQHGRGIIYNIQYALNVLKYMGICDFRIITTVGIDIYRHCRIYISNYDIHFAYMQSNRENRNHYVNSIFESKHAIPLLFVYVFNVNTEAEPK